MAESVICNELNTVVTQDKNNLSKDVIIHTIDT